MDIPLLLVVPFTSLRALRAQSAALSMPIVVPRGNRKVTTNLPLSVVVVVMKKKYDGLFRSLRAIQIYEFVHCIIILLLKRFTGAACPSVEYYITIITANPLKNISLLLL